MRIHRLMQDILTLGGIPVTPIDQKGRLVKKEAVTATVSKENENETSTTEIGGKEIKIEFVNTKKSNKKDEEELKMIEELDSVFEPNELGKSLIF